MPFWHNVAMTMTPSKTVEKSKLRAMRLERGLSQAQLAERTGYDQSTIQRLESGRRRMKDYQYAALARALGCTASELIESDGVAFVDQGVKEAAEILSALSPDQRALWFQVGHSFIEPRQKRKDMD